MTKKLLVILFVIFIFVSALVFRNECIAGTKSGIEICLNEVLPSLIPFIFLSSLISKLVPNGKFSVFIPFILGNVSGFPVGAKSVSDLYKNSIINKKCAEDLLLCCNNAGIGFIFSFIGGLIFNSAKLSFILFSFQFLLSLIIFLFVFFNNEFYACDNKICSFSLSEIITDSVKSCLDTALLISSFVIVFSFIKKLIFALINTKSALLISVVSMITEVSGGCKSAAVLPENISIPLIFAGVGFGGISVHLQTLKILSDAKLSAKKHLYGKIIMAVFLLICGIIHNRVL